MIVQGLKGIASSSTASLPLSLPSLAAVPLAGFVYNYGYGRHHFISSRMFATESPLDNIFEDGPDPKMSLQDANKVPASADSAQSATVTSTTRRRRVRYKGNYPRNFNEKYKELQGDEATVQKVLNKGMTPAGRHVPILLEECLHHLGLLESTRDGPTFYVDCTLGYGGHSSQVLKRLLEDGNKDNRLLCFDRDPVEIIKAADRLHNIFKERTAGDSQFDTSPVTTVDRNFCEVHSYLEEMSGVGKVTALLADLGLSSMQMDDAERGFTYKREGPLDMRMAGTTSSTDTESAYDLLSRVTVKQLTKMLQENSDEEHAHVIAHAILGNSSTRTLHGRRRGDSIPSTTVALANVVRDAVRPLISPPDPNRRQTGNGPSHNSSAAAAAAVSRQLDSTVARVMQAIRIAVNSEFESLEELLDDLPLILAPGGRAVFLTFHSGEDRRVKKAFKAGFKNGIYSSWSRDVVRPSAKERQDNPRSSCCKLRWAVRSEKEIDADSKVVVDRK
jgi:16S rRNA (cytosine1402-N4)-methyltransferase